MFKHLSKLTLKYTTPHYHPITSSMIESWLKDIQIGLDALLDDQILMAEDIFTCKLTEKSPFHAFGNALLDYTKAMLSMERATIDQAIQTVIEVQVTLKRALTKKTKIATGPCIHTSYSAPIDLPTYHVKPVLQDAIELQFELLDANCILMSATLQFLRDNWFDHLKAAYDLRKAYKIYERLFETATGVTVAKYETKKKRIVSYHDGQVYTCLLSDTIEHGAYFGIGLFSVIFSLLPNKVGKILNTLGFQVSRINAIIFLEKAYHSETMYSSISALILLAYYTNISNYISPRLNQCFLLKDATCILERMKKSFPQGYIWNLMEAKFQKLLGQLDDSILLLKQAKNPVIHRVETNQDYFRNASITEFTQFKTFLLYELGWSYIYTGNYFEASETFFCLESICNWSRVFYHYISTCCMIAEGRYDKAVLEIGQMTKILEQRKPNNNELFAESRIKLWIEISVRNQTTLRETLQFDIVNPLWELVYLWNGIRLLSTSIINEIKQKPKTDPMVCLLIGVIGRDIENNMELAMECFNLSLVLAEKNKSWIMPYAMYEIATTHCILLREKGHVEYKLIILDWINCIENYYSQNTQDNEWEARMQLRCQLLIESYK